MADSDIQWVALFREGDPILWHPTVKMENKSISKKNLVNSSILLKIVQLSKHPDRLTQPQTNLQSVIQCTKYHTVLGLMLR